MENYNKEMNGLMNLLKAIIVVVVVALFSVAVLLLNLLVGTKTVNQVELTMLPKAGNSPVAPKETPEVDTFWHAPATEALAAANNSEQLDYGKELIANTALYFGPKGKVKAMATNGMNCQNCHLDAGTRVFGNNYSAVAATYPKYRARSGSEENIYKRVNDCFERSLNGQSLDTASPEMQAIAAYINWLGAGVPKGKKAAGSGLKSIEFLNRAADPLKGQVVYVEKCQVCHQGNGQGTMNPDGTAFTYPPLWGKNSYNDGAGLYRLSNFAKYVKYNMPLGANHNKPQLSDEEAWDVAAFINSQPRPKKDIRFDWPKIEEKPIDHPFGPFSDGFSEEQHKFGPFKPIKEAKKLTTASKKA